MKILLIALLLAAANVGVYFISYTVSASCGDTQNASGPDTFTGYCPSIGEVNPLTKTEH